LFLRWEAVRQAAREASQSQRSRAAAPNDNGRRAGGGLLAKEDCTTDWDLGFEAPEAVRTGERPVLVPRDGLGRMKQTYYLVGRSLRQHSSSFFLAVCMALILDGAVFSSLLRSSQEYNYTIIINWLTGGTGGAPLFTLIVACYFRPLFANERLSFFREAKSGISVFGYWLAKNAHSSLLLPLLTAAFCTSCFLATIPLQSYWSFFISYFLAAWYWAGGAMMVAACASSELSSTLILIFWPLFEPVLQGNEALGTTVKGSPFSFVTCGRWLQQSLYGAELLALPEQIRVYPEVSTTLDNRLMLKDSLSELVAEARAVLFAWGLLFRLISLFALAQHKYGACFITPHSLQYVKNVTHLLFDRFKIDAKLDPDAALAELLATSSVKLATRSQKIKNWDGQSIRMLDVARTVGNAPPGIPNSRRASEGHHAARELKAHSLKL